MDSWFGLGASEVVVSRSPAREDGKNVRSKARVQGRSQRHAGAPAPSSPSSLKAARSLPPANQSSYLSERAAMVQNFRQSSNQASAKQQPSVEASPQRDRHSTSPSRRDFTMDPNSGRPRFQSPRFSSRRSQREIAEQSVHYHEAMKSVKRRSKSARKAVTERPLPASSSKRIVPKLEGRPRPEWAPPPPKKESTGAPAAAVTWKERPQVRAKSARERSGSSEKLHMPLRMGEAPPLPEGDPDHSMIDRMKVHAHHDFDRNPFDRNLLIIGSSALIVLRFTSHFHLSPASTVSRVVVRNGST